MLYRLGVLDFIFYFEVLAIILEAFFKKFLLILDNF